MFPNKGFFFGTYRVFPKGLDYVSIHTVTVKVVRRNFFLSLSDA